MTAPANDREPLVPLTLLASTLRMHATQTESAIKLYGDDLCDLADALHSIADQLDEHAGTKISGQ